MDTIIVDLNTLLLKQDLEPIFNLSYENLMCYILDVIVKLPRLNKRFFKDREHYIDLFKRSHNLRECMSSRIFLESMYKVHELACWLLRECHDIFYMNPWRTMSSADYFLSLVRAKCVYGSAWFVIKLHDVGICHPDFASFAVQNNQFLLFEWMTNECVHEPHKPLHCIIRNAKENTIPWLKKYITKYSPVILYERHSLSLLYEWIRSFHRSEYEQSYNIFCFLCYYEFEFDTVKWKENIESHYEIPLFEFCKSILTFALKCRFQEFAFFFYSLTSMHILYNSEWLVRLAIHSNCFSLTQHLLKDGLYKIINDTHLHYLDTHAFSQHFVDVDDDELSRELAEFSALRRYMQTLCIKNTIVISQLQEQSCPICIEKEEFYFQCHICKNIVCQTCINKIITQKPVCPFCRRRLK